MNVLNTMELFSLKCFISMLCNFHLNWETEHTQQTLHGFSQHSLPSFAFPLFLSGEEGVWGLAPNSPGDLV